MDKKRSPSEAQRAQIVILCQEGYIERAISERLAVSKTAVHQAVVKFKNCGSYSDCKSSSRPWKTTRWDNILIERCVMKSPTCSPKRIWAELGETGSRISKRTISHRLTNKFSLKSWKPARKPRLAPAMKLKRLQLAKKYKDWTSQQWSRVLFSNETTIQQFAWGRELWGDHQELGTMRDSHSKPWNTRRVWWFGKWFQPKERPAYSTSIPEPPWMAKNIWNWWKRSWSYTLQCIIVKYLCTMGRHAIGQKSSRTFSRQKISNCRNGWEIAWTLIQLRISEQNWRTELLRSIQPVFHRLLRPSSHPGFSTCPQSCAETSSRACRDGSGRC